MPATPALTKDQLDKLTRVVQLAQDWIKAYNDNKIGELNNATLAKQFFETSALLNKAQKTLNAQKQQAAPQKSSGFNPLSLFGDIERLWTSSGIGGILTKGGDIAQSVIDNANTVVGWGDKFLSIASSIPFISKDMLSKVKYYVDGAKKVIGWGQSAANVLKQWSNIGSIWNTVKSGLQGVTNPAADAINQGKGLVQSVKDFINLAKGVPTAQDKVGQATQLLTALEGMLSKAGATVDAVLGDKDGNGLPDWYDNIRKMADPFINQTSLVPGTNIDDKVLAKAREILAMIEDWLKKATALGKLITDKIKMFKDMLAWLTGTAAKLNKFINDGKKLVDNIKAGNWQAVYDQIKQWYRDIDKLTGFIPGTDWDDKIIAKMKEFKKMADDFIQKWTGFKDAFEAIDAVRNMIGKVGPLLTFASEFKDAVKAGDYKKIFAMLKQAYDSIEKISDFIPGKFGEELEKKVVELRNKINDFLKSKGIATDLKDLFDQAEKMLDTLNGFYEGGKKLLAAVKSGDPKAIFEVLMAGYKEIDKLTGFIPGTDVDDKLIAKVQSVKQGLEKWLKDNVGVEGVEDLVAQGAKFVKDLRTLEAEGKKFLENIKSGNWGGVVDQLAKSFDFLKKTNSLIPGNTAIETKTIAAIHKFLGDADSILKKITGQEGFQNHVDRIKGWISEANSVVEFSKGLVQDIKNKDAIAAFNRIMGGLQSFMNYKGEGILQAPVDKMQTLVKEAESWLSNATNGTIPSFASLQKQLNGAVSAAKGIMGFYNALKGNIENKDFAAAIQTLLKGWDDLNKSGGLIPGPDVTDALIAKSAAFKKQIEEFLAKHTNGVLSGDLASMVDQIKGYYKQVTTFIDEAKGLLDDIKSGNVAGAFQRLQKGWDEFEKRKGDIIPGTNIDEKIYQYAQSLYGQATTFLTKLVKGGSDADKAKVVQGWLGSAGKVISLFMSKEPIYDISALYNTDTSKVEIPAEVKLNPMEEDQLLAQLTGGAGGKLNDRLRSALQATATEASSVGLQMDSSYNRTLDRQIDTVNVFMDAKKLVDSVAKENERINGLIRGIAETIVKVVTSVLLSPAAATVVQTVFKSMRDWTSLSDVATSILNNVDIKTGNSIADMGISGIKMLLGTLNSSGKEGEMTKINAPDLEKQYKALVTARYKEVKEVLSTIQSKIVDTIKQVAQMDDKATEQIKSHVASNLKQIKDVLAQIRSKYINNPQPPMCEPLAKKNLVRYMLTYWIISLKKDNKIESFIHDAAAKVITDYGIMGEAGVNWNGGFGGKLARGLGSIFGRWASFGEGKKVDQLVEFSKKEYARLDNPAPWQNVL